MCVRAHIGCTDIASVQQMFALLHHPAGDEAFAYRTTPRKSTSLALASLARLPRLLPCFSLCLSLCLCLWYGVCEGSETMC